MQGRKLQVVDPARRARRAAQIALNIKAAKERANAAMAAEKVRLTAFYKRQVDEARAAKVEEQRRLRAEYNLEQERQKREYAEIARAKAARRTKVLAGESELTRASLARSAKRAEQLEQRKKPGVSSSAQSVIVAKSPVLEFFELVRPKGQIRRWYGFTGVN